MRYPHAACATLCAVVLATSASAQTHTLATDVADTIAKEAVAACSAQGVKATVKVVDAANTQKAVARAEGSTPLGLDFAQAKINTVILTGQPSGGPGAPQTVKGANPKVMVFTGVVGVDGANGKLIYGISAGGAVPIMIGTELVGVVGVSGAPSPGTDIACANAGLAKVADRLK